MNNMGIINANKLFYLNQRFDLIYKILYLEHYYGDKYEKE